MYVVVLQVLGDPEIMDDSQEVLHPGAGKVNFPQYIKSHTARKNRTDRCIGINVFAGKCLPSGGDDESDLFVSDADDARTSDADSLKSIKDSSTSVSSLESVVGFIYCPQ